jgi:hypothetical protein
MTSLVSAKRPDALPLAGARVFGAATEGIITGGREPLRAIAVGDGDFASNSFFPYMANSAFLISAVRWLAREDRGTTVASRTAVPPLILLTAPQTRLVFGLVVVLLPFSAMAAGFVVWWRRR